MNTKINKPRYDLYLDVQEYIGQIVTAKTESEMVVICSDIADSLEISYFSHGLMWADDFHNVSFKIISNYNKKWLTEYDNQNYYSVDPRAKECMSSATPVFWNTEKPYLEKLKPDAKEMMENAHEHKVSSGVTAPIFGFKNVKGAFSFGLTSNDSLRKQNRHLELISPYVSYLGVFVHQSMIRISNLEKDQTDVSLTEREKDCLCWAADGKMTSEIASLLFLSSSTVKYHLKNAMFKLGAKNTPQALSIAIIKGYIQPSMKMN